MSMSVAKRGDQSMGARLTRMRNRKRKRRVVLFRSLTYAVLIACMAGIIVVGLAKVLGPPPLHVPINSTYYDDSELVIAKTNQSGIKREWVPLEEIADELIEATIAIEDKRFYDHHGFDIKRIIGSALKNMKARSKVEGASTITMQYARNVFLSHEKTWTRKLKETFYAIRLELHYSKDEILEGYLNTIYYGHGAYGVEEAANYYFQKSAKELTLSEASMLAGIPKGPTYYSPEHSFDKAKQRQELVLEAMANTGYITNSEKTKAKSENLSIARKENRKKETAPYFLDVVEEALIEEVGLSKETIEAGGLNVYTTLNTEMQKKAETWIEQTIKNNDELQSALISLDPNTGAIKALVGGRNYEKSSFNRATKAKRAPGSTIKPLLYYAALENGFTPSTPLLSEKTTFTFNNGRETYSPNNYGNRYANDFITLAQALAVSDNTFAVKTHILIGFDKLVEVAKKVGISTKLPKYPSLALGTEPVSMLELTQAYATFANGGKEVIPYVIEKVTDANGDVIYEREPKQKEKQVLNEHLAFVMTHLMKGMFDRNLNGYTNVTGSSIQSVLTRPAAGKSGTTETDSWMIGFTPQLVTAVWTGYDKGKTLHPVNDTGYAKRIWAHYMEDALQSMPAIDFKPTNKTVGVKIDPLTGQKATEKCKQTFYAYYMKGTEPTDYCPLHSEHKTEESPAENKEKKWWEILLKPFVETWILKMPEH